MLELVIDELFELAIKHQTHSADLLQVTKNAHLTEGADHDDGGKMKVFYNIRPGMDHHCETACHDFIKQYIRRTLGITYNDYKALYIYSSERSREIDELVFEESNTIQVEMLIYLKIWECETFLKKMH